MKHHISKKHKIHPNKSLKRQKCGNEREGIGSVDIEFGDNMDSPMIDSVDLGESVRSSRDVD